MVVIGKSVRLMLLLEEEVLLNQHKDLEKLHELWAPKYPTAV